MARRKNRRRGDRPRSRNRKRHAQSTPPLATDNLALAPNEVVSELIQRQWAPDEATNRVIQMHNQRRSQSAAWIASQSNQQHHDALVLQYAAVVASSSQFTEAWIKIEYL